MTPIPDQQIVFIDSAVEDKATLIAALTGRVEWVVLHANSDGMEQIALAMQGRSGVGTVHLLSHGEPGALLMGGARIDLASLPKYRHVLETISNAMREDGQCLLYGCEVASGATGRLFVETLAQQTGLRVSAASHKIGSLELGGSWELDYAPHGVRQALNVPLWRGILMAAPTLGLPITLAFATKVDYGTGTNPRSVISADVNGDGNADLVVANDGSNTVSVLLGTGTGTFDPKVDYTGVSYPQSVTSADVNGDGKADLVVANSNSNSVSVLLGAGTGTFGTRTVYATGDHPISVISADINGDGKADLVTANYFDDTVSVLLGTGTGTFGTKIDYAMTSGATSVTSADVNGDGKADLVVANNFNDTVSVLLGTGTGTFDPKVDYAAGRSPTSVTSADVNGDGKADLIVANRDAVSVLLGTGTGTFGAKTDYATGSSPYSVTSADVNGDGKADLVVANNYSNKVSVLLGTGTGTFGARTDYATGSDAFSVTIADVNGDGKADLVAANSGSNTVSVLRNTSSILATAFTEQTAVAASAALTLADADGNADWIGGSLKVQITANNESADTLGLATANPGGSGIWVDTSGNKLMAGLVQIGTASAASVSNGTALTLNFLANATNALVQASARAVQFNNSSDTPGVLTREVTFTATDNTAGTASGVQTITVTAVNDAPTIAGVPGTAQAVRVGMVAALADFTVADVDSGTLTVTLSATNGTIDGVADADGVLAGLQLTGTAASINTAMAAATFTASAPGAASIGISVSDGVAAPVTATYSLTAANTAPTLSLPTTLALATKVDDGTGSRPYSVISADVNGDGKADLITPNYNDSTVSVLLGDGTGTFGAKTDYATGTSPQSVTSADVNGDGKADLVVANFGSATVSVLLGTGTGTFGAKTDYATGNHPTSVTSADVNGDGKADLVVANTGSATVSVLLGTGTGIFGARIDYATGSNPFSVTSADVNGDGKADLVVANTGSDTVSVLLGTGTGTFGAKADYATGTGPASVTSADVNGDGKADLAVANDSSNTVSVLLGTGTGTFGAKTDYATGTNPFSVTSADVNGDGKADLVVANYVSDTVSVLLGTGTGTFGPRTDYATGTKPRSVTSADVNGDGKADLIVANDSGSMVSVLRNTGIVIATAFTEQTAVAASAALTLADADGNADWIGGSLKVQITANNESADTLSLATANPGGGGIWVDTAGNKLMAGLIQIGTASAASVSNGTALTLNFLANATNALVQASARAVQFNNSSDTPGLLTRDVTFTATDKHAGTASGVQTITVTAVNDAPPESPVDPTPVRNVNGLTAEQENAAPGLAVPGGRAPVSGDGNGDGILDSLQAAVASAPFVNSASGQGNPGNASSSYLTLVAGSVNGKVDASTTLVLTNVGQTAAPAKLPAGMLEPLGLISFGAVLSTTGATETFSLYVDSALGVNGFWKQNVAGVWINLASAAYGGAVVSEGNKLRLDFTLTDGGEFDTDGKADGVATCAGAPGFMALSIVGYSPKLDDGAHFWS
jgi:large repetitive protein